MLKHRVFGDILEIVIESPKINADELSRDVSAILSHPQVKPGMKLLLIILPNAGVLSSGESFKIMKTHKDDLKAYFKKIAGVAFTEVHYGHLNVLSSAAQSYGIDRKSTRLNSSHYS